MGSDGHCPKPLAERAAHSNPKPLAERAAHHAKLALPRLIPKLFKTLHSSRQAGDRRTLAGPTA